MEVYKFSLRVREDVLSSEGPYPIIEELTGKFVGAFTVQAGDLISCFLSTQDHPLALNIANKEAFYMTLQTNSEGKADKAIISAVPMHVFSYTIKGNKYEG